MTENSTLKIQKETFPFLNISLYLKSISLISFLSIKNDSDVDSKNLLVKISSDIDCSEPFTFQVENIVAGSEFQVAMDDFKVKREFLNQISETEKAQFKIEVFQKEMLVATDSFSVDVHPLEFFGGFEILPELIASYITPNNPYVYYLLKKAVEILERENLKTAFEGYQSNDPERVLQMMSVIYTAVQNEGIVYSSLPPGFEKFGQRLRLLGTIEQQKFANCIDLSLLFAACLEAIDLNPIIVVTNGHAFVGCWLEDQKFPEIINDDKTAITKRLAKGIREIAVFEATTICKGNQIPFSSALNLGESQLIEKEDFILSIDVKRARTARIRPLPLIQNSPEIKLDESKLDEIKDYTLESEFKIGTIYQDDFNGKLKVTKQKIWERKLLDLSLRNNLLNIRMTKNMLQFIDIDINHLEDNLSDGKSFSILPNGNSERLRRYNLFTQPLHRSSPLFEMANDEIKYNRLLTHYHPEDLETILSFMSKNAKLAIDENGSSTLYLAVGLLKWYDRKTPEQPRYAPILLIPVELSRRSVNSKFSLKSREEETMINITLLEFLRQEYELNLNALEVLPTDEKGVDVAKVMGILRRTVMQLKGWDVEEQLILGNFSFSKLILWKDIVVHQNELQNNKVVKSLAEGKLTFNDYEKGREEADFDEMNPAEMILPIAADVSQMEAVWAAQKGKTFVLHGPPGTGKSQTITNIIADALYRDKKVLFVAAKKAALEVVQNRLEQIGLAPFALEMHSNKSKKSEILEKLGKSLENPKIRSGYNFQAESERLLEAKKTVSYYVNSIHKKRNIGWSLYDSIGILEDLKYKNFVKKEVLKATLENTDEVLRQKQEDWVLRFQAISKLIVHPKNNPFQQFKITQYSSQTEAEIGQQNTLVLSKISEVKSLGIGVWERLQNPFPLKTFENWFDFQKSLIMISELSGTPISFVKFLSEKQNVMVFDEWRTAFKQFQNALNKILSHYNRTIFEFPIPSLEMEWKMANQSWFLPKWLKKNKVKKQLNLYRKSKITDDLQVEDLFREFQAFSEAKNTLQQNRFRDVENSLQILFKDEHTDLGEIENSSQKIHDLTNTFSKNENVSLKAWLQNFLNKNAVFVEDIFGNDKARIQNFIKDFNQLQTQFSDFEILTKFNFEESQDSDNWIEKAESFSQKVQNQLGSIKDWVNYVNIRNQGNDLNTGWFIDAFENDAFKIEDSFDFFKFNLATSFAEHVINEDETLRLFNTGLFENSLEQFRKISKNFTEISRQELILKLQQKMPDSNFEAMQSSELGILQKAIRSRGRGTSIRKLFDQIPTLFPRIAPCMLMSPISVAQYFDVSTDHFDLVIFDEASQLPTCESLSALARAKQAIIVGDPKQMPPTSFFTSSKTDEENIEIEDLESILDDCLSLSVPSHYLLRHYRSKHESLIAFSNANYYENKLLTFPSADDLSRKVVYHNVSGYYDKGNTRQNKFEADEIVKYIKEHYSDSKKRKFSLGVVTFSQTQQNLIEEKLYNLFKENLEIEAFANEGEEPLFIKNLENVQGDERDYILFSICYAPDSEGKMAMNFGPLNREGGWRRLNVAITRARYEMHVFATLNADRIDLSRTSSQGVAGLKAFLSFAEKGNLILHAQGNSQNEQGLLAKSIVQKLAEKGWAAKLNVGTSASKIEVAVVDPDNPEKYILGVLIDGKYYRDAKTTNDREMILPSVLKNLGWNIFRLWTMDWYINSEKVIDKIVEKLQGIRSGEIFENDNSTLIVERKESENLQTPDFSFDGKMDHHLTESFTNAETITVKNSPIFATADIADEKSYPQDTLQIPYSACYLLPVPNSYPDMIYDFWNREKIREQIREIVNTEAPISRNSLYRKVISLWNISRIGGKIKPLFGRPCFRDVSFYHHSFAIILLV